MDQPYRRIVTGHSPAGKAIIESDNTLHPVSLYDQTKTQAPDSTSPGNITLFRSEGFPASNTAPFKDLARTPLPLTDPVRSTLRIIDMAPESSSPMHRTVSLDFAIVLKGEVVLELDDGVEATVREQDAVVQRGTIHAWHNRAKQSARMLFVIMPSDKVKLEDGTELGVEGMDEEAAAA